MKMKDQMTNMSKNEIKGSLVEINLDDLIFYERCGGGTFGSVYRALWLSQNMIVAVKRLLFLDKEAHVLNQLSHKNIIKFYAAVMKDPDYCLVTEYAPNDSLYSYLKVPENALDFKLIVRWATDIAQGVSYLHWESPVPIIHRDLKSKNIVISADWTCKLCDFGASRIAGNTTKMTLAGTFPWMAPEAIQSFPLSESSDVWSYGVVLWELLTKEVPFNGIEGFQVAWLIVEKGQRLMIPSSCPPSFRKMMEQCWNDDPKKRPTMKQILPLLKSMSEDEALPDLTNSFLDHRGVWKKEIQATLDQLKRAERELSNKERELREREFKLQEREKSLLQQYNVVKLEDHDVNTWRDVDVYQWVLQLNQSGDTADLAHYADLFLKHHITGRRLLLLTKDDLRDMGVTSVGHIMDFLLEINTLKIHNFRLLNFPPLAKSEDSVSVAMENKTFSLILIFGHHFHKGATDEGHDIIARFRQKILRDENEVFDLECKFSNKETKWKMYVEIDHDDTEETSALTQGTFALTLVKDVSFTCKVPAFGTFTMTHPPFIMGTWCQGVVEDMTIECVVSFESVVLKPTSTKFSYQLRTDSPTSKQKLVTLTLDRFHHTSDSVASSVTPSQVTSPSHTAGMSMSSAASQPSLAPVWRKNFQPVELPPSRSTSKPDLWAGVVSGRRPSQVKHIPGTANVLGEFPSLIGASGHSSSNASPSKDSTRMSYTETSYSTLSTSVSTDPLSSYDQGSAHHSYADACRPLPGQKPYNESCVVKDTPPSQRHHTDKKVSVGGQGSKGRGYKKTVRMLDNKEEMPWGRQNSQHTKSEPGSKSTPIPDYRRAFSGGPITSPSNCAQNGHHRKNLRGGKGSGNYYPAKEGYHGNYDSRRDRDNSRKNYRNRRSFDSQYNTSVHNNGYDIRESEANQGGDPDQTRRVDKSGGQIERKEEVEAGWDIVERKRRSSFRLED